MDQGKGLDPQAVSEVCGTKQHACIIGHERAFVDHLYGNKREGQSLSPEHPILPPDRFGDTVSIIFDRYEKTK